MEYAEYTLNDEIKLRENSIPKKYFTNDEIYFLMKNLIYGLALL